MKLSILLITYNQEGFIQDCIGSIILQVKPFEYEIIVADDCSIDNTLQIIEQRFSEAGVNYRVLDTKRNLGFVKNYQLGFSECKGEYVAVIEGDDYWTSPDKLIKHLNFLDSHMECVLSFDRTIQYFEKENKFIISNWNLYDDFEYINSNQMAEGNKIGNLSSCVFRNSAVRKLKPEIFNLKIADWMLGIALGQFGLLARLKYAMTVYRIHPHGQWNKMTILEQETEILKLIDEYNEFLNYKYNNEFHELKNNLISKEIKVSYFKKISDYIPPIFILVLKVLVPVKLRKFLKNNLDFLA